MQTLAQFLKDMALDDEFVIPAAEVAELSRRFGSGVRGMGRWNADGTLTISKEIVREGLQGIPRQTVLEAAMQLDAEQAFSEMLQSSSAALIVEKVAEANRRRLRELMTSIQETQDPKEIARLKQEIIQQVFPF
jgi:hypothetical protein